VENRKGKVGIVLGGGGAKGSYQIGCWKAFNEVGLDYDLVVGTSVGALNGALMAQRSFDEAYHMWMNIDNAKVMADIPNYEDTDENTVVASWLRQIIKNGGIDISPLEENVRLLIDEDRLRASGVEYGMVTVDISTKKPMEIFLHDIPQGKVCDYMIASASAYPAFKAKSIDNSTFIDGGYYDNLPINMALNAKTKADEIYVINVEGIGRTRKFKTDIPVHILKTYWDLGNMLTFDTEISRRNITLGYHDGLKYFGLMDGYAYTFEHGHTLLMELRYLKELRKIWDGLITKSAGRSYLGKLSKERIEDAMKHRREKPKDANGMLLTCAELAAEILGLDPARRYTLESFNAAIIKALAKEKAEGKGKQLLARLREISALKIADELKNITAPVILLAVAEQLNKHLGGEGEIPLEAMAMAAPRECAAALYLIAFDRRENRMLEIKE